MHPFKVPTAHEIDHDFLWRASVRLPARGHIGIFNRSYYEEVLGPRAPGDFGPAEATARARRQPHLRGAARGHPQLGRNGTAIIKFFLNVSKDEQKRRFLERIDNPEKHWKFALGDIEERKHWSAYMAAYEDAIRETATQDAPRGAGGQEVVHAARRGRGHHREARTARARVSRNSEATPQQMAAARKALLSER